MGSLLSQKLSGEKAAELAKIFSDATRVNIVELLMHNPDGLTTTDICTTLGVLQPRVSSHLSIMLKHGVVSVFESGRQRVYTLGSKKFGSIVKDLVSAWSPGPREVSSTSSEALNHVKSNSEIRQCRTCYDHLAGVAGVGLLDEMLREGWLVANVIKRLGASGRMVYRLTRLGSKSLEERGVDVGGATSSNRVFAYGCQDWTERRPHLGGSLGSAILDSILSQGLVKKMEATRALVVVKPVSSWIRAEQ